MLPNGTDRDEQGPAESADGVSGKAEPRDSHGRNEEATDERKQDEREAMAKQTDVHCVPFNDARRPAQAEGPPEAGPLA